MGRLGARDMLEQGYELRRFLRFSGARDSRRWARQNGGQNRQLLRADLMDDRRFVRLSPAGNLELEEDLCDQLFNQSEKRLARVLLKLARLRDLTSPIKTRTITICSGHACSSSVVAVIISACEISLGSRLHRTGLPVACNSACRLTGNPHLLA
jgi:hypothetical protein